MNARVFRGSIDQAALNRLSLIIRDQARLRERRFLIKQQHFSEFRIPTSNLPSLFRPAFNDFDPHFASGNHLVQASPFQR